MSVLFASTLFGSTLFASIGTLLAVNVFCAIIALAIGFVAGVWFFGGSKTVVQAPSPQDSAKAAEAVRTSERAVMASGRLKDLASGISSDVDAHTAQVEAVSANLRAMQSEENGKVDEAVFAAITKIVEANNSLQQQLESAEQQIASQADEILLHESEARTDSLTDLGNRRAFDDEMDHRIAEWRRKGTPFNLMIMDIDHFKKFNDTHGHLAGDEVLRNVGKLLTKALRDMDIPCRYGGEEFAAIMPDTETEGARIVAERIRTTIEEATILFENKKLKVTTSVGLAQVIGDEEAAQLIKRADEALYVSKEAGRNCGHLHIESRCVPITPGMECPEQDEASLLESSKRLDRLPNRTAFVEELRRRVAESQRFGLPLSVMHLGIDSYSSIQEEYGSAVAYLTLDSVAKFVEEALREMDLLARLEEGQFVVMLPGSTSAEASQIASRIETAMSNCIIPLEGTKLHLSIHHGIVTAEADSSAQSLMKNAQHIADKMGQTKQPAGV